VRAAAEEMEEGRAVGLQEPALDNEPIHPLGFEERQGLGYASGSPHTVSVALKGGLQASGSLGGTGDDQYLHARAGAHDTVEALL